MALPSSSRNPSEIRFCLDANLSYRVVESVTPDSDTLVHVSRVPELTAEVRGRPDAPDRAIAAWCAENRVVLVTCDDDFRGRRTRTRELVASGLEVIVFAHEIRGLGNQIDVISRNLNRWQNKLARYPYGSRVWIQYRTGPLRLDA